MFELKLAKLVGRFYEWLLAKLKRRIEKRDAANLRKLDSEVSACGRSLDVCRQLAQRFEKDLDAAHETYVQRTRECNAALNMLDNALSDTKTITNSIIVEK
jgi:hypothetical protein